MKCKTKLSGLNVKDDSIREHIQNVNNCFILTGNVNKSKSSKKNINE